MSRLAILLVISLTATTTYARPARDVLGSLITLVVVAEVCFIPIQPAERKRLTASGERIQQVAGLTDDEVDRFAAALAANHDSSNCPTEPDFSTVLAETLAEADTVR